MQGGSDFSCKNQHSYEIPLTFILITIIERKKIYGVSRQSKIPYISNHFANCDQKAELSAVFSAIYYLKLKGHFVPAWVQQRKKSSPLNND